MSFVEELSGLGIVMLFDGELIIKLKVKIPRNNALLDVMKVSDKDLNFSSNEAVRVLDARSLGYYKTDHKALQENLSNYQIENLQITQIM